MKKLFLRVMAFAVIAALVWVGCSDNGVQDKNAEVGEFVNMFVGGGARYTLTVNAMPPGNGTVSRYPESAAYKPGSTVTVTATPKDGYAFIGWSGTLSDADDIITVTMNDNVTLTANFQEIRQYTLNAGVYPSDGGSVSRTPSQTTYKTGTSVTVTATAAIGYRFTGWTGATNDTTESVTISMNSDIALTANFQKITYTLATNVYPSGTGSVSRSPNQTSYTYGEQVTVTATSASGYPFTGWSGASTSTSSSVTITMNGDKTLTANFFTAFTDTRDSKTYETVIIGGERWMAKNLNYQPSTGNFWCYSNNEANCNTYGRLYDWETAKKVCPNGWHLPSNQEWDALVTAAGGYAVAGKKLKSTSGWNYNGNGTDDYGFSALPAGYRYADGSFSSAGLNGHWWTASEDGGGNAYGRDMYYSYGYVGEGSSGKGYGFSVRCVED